MWEDRQTIGLSLVNSEDLPVILKSFTLPPPKSSVCRITMPAKLTCLEAPYYGVWESQV